MPRAKANPDPLVIEYERQAPPGGKFTITALRDGSFSVERAGQVLAARGPQIGSHFGAARYPSNRLQAEAVEAAKMRIEGMRLSGDD